MGYENIDLQTCQVPNASGAKGISKGDLFGDKLNFVQKKNFETFLKYKRNSLGPFYLLAAHLHLHPSMGANQLGAQQFHLFAPIDIEYKKRWLRNKSVNFSRKIKVYIMFGFWSIQIELHVVCSFLLYEIYRPTTVSASSQNCLQLPYY